MGLYLRGEMWWFEIRNRRGHIRKSTGFRRGEKAKARAVFDAAMLAQHADTPRNVLEGVLSAIYGSGAASDKGLALAAVEPLYAEYARWRGMMVTKKTAASRSNMFARFVTWAETRNLRRVSDISVAVARQFVDELRRGGAANKTLRNNCQFLSSYWRIAAQMSGAPFRNPWTAATPVPDGSGEVREAFTPEQEARLMAAAREVGHGWYLAAMISRWTGLRYGDVSRLDWAEVDMARRVISVTPSKTRRHGVKVLLPISDALFAALNETPAARRVGFVLPEHSVGFNHLQKTTPYSVVLKAAGVCGAYTFHSWRHTFRTRLAEAGVGEEVARRLGGWTSLKMAAHYDHASHLAEMRQAVSAMESGGCAARK